MKKCQVEHVTHGRSESERGFEAYFIHLPPYSSVAPQLPILPHEVAPSLAEQDIRLPNVVSEDRMALHGNRRRHSGRTWN
jgi:hypothetical protein